MTEHTHTHTPRPNRAKLVLAGLLRLTTQRCGGGDHILSPRVPPSVGQRRRDDLYPSSCDSASFCLRRCEMLEGFPVHDELTAAADVSTS